MGGTPWSPPSFIATCFESEWNLYGWHSVATPSLIATCFESEWNLYGWHSVVTPFVDLRHLPKVSGTCRGGTPWPPLR
jgi:hypothetical protein